MFASETIQGRKLFKEENYSRAETIRGNTVIEYEEPYFLI
jgi:hypothetical protein